MGGELASDSDGTNGVLDDLWVLPVICPVLRDLECSHIGLLDQVPHCYRELTRVIDCGIH